jgi:hypothetical protein
LTRSESNIKSRSSTGAAFFVTLCPPVITGHIVVALRAIKIVRKTVLTAPTTFAPLVGLLSGFDLLQTFLDQTVFSSFLGQLFAPSFILAGQSLAISTRRLFRGHIKIFSAHTAGSFEHFLSPYLPTSGYTTVAWSENPVPRSLSVRSSCTSFDVTGQIRLA